jgi:hypothetical protein
MLLWAHEEVDLEVGLVHLEQMEEGWKRVIRKVKFPCLLTGVQHDRFQMSLNLVRLF